MLFNPWCSLAFFSLSFLKALLLTLHQTGTHSVGQILVEVVLSQREVYTELLGDLVDEVQVTTESLTDAANPCVLWMKESKLCCPGWGAVLRECSMQVLLRPWQGFLCLFIGSNAFVVVTVGSGSELIMLSFRHNREVTRRKDCHSSHSTHV